MLNPPHPLPIQPPPPLPPTLCPRLPNLPPIPCHLVPTRTQGPQPLVTLPPPFTRV
jgi:hypothetical protein